MSLVIGIDIGTYEAKGVVVDECGTVIASAARQHQLSVPRPGFAEHDAEEVWWGGLVELVTELLADEAVYSEQIAAISCSGIGPCVLPLDRTGIPLRPAILYGIDTRATAQIAQLNALLGEETILARSGNPLSSQSAGPKIAWIQAHEPEVYEATHRFVTCQSFLVGRLTGEWVIDHGTAGYFHPLYSLREQRWDLTGCESLVREDQLPRLAWATEIAGTITRSAALATGLPEGIPVLVGTADAPAEAVSSGIHEPGQMMLMYGSSHFFIEMLDQPVIADSLYAAPYVFEGSYALAAGTSTAGTISRWFIDLLGLKQTTRGEVFTELAREAETSPPGARGLLALPHFSGERTPLDDPLLSGALIGLTLTHSRADVHRAFLEGIAHGVSDVLDRYRQAKAIPRSIRAAGGGVKNSVWTQAVSDISGLPQQLTVGTGASYGDAMLAALAIGMVKDRATLSHWVRFGETIAPREELREFYLDRFALWKELQNASRGISHALRSESDKGEK